MNSWFRGILTALLLLPAPVVAFILIPGTTTSVHYEAFLFMALGFYVGAGFFVHYFFKQGVSE